LRPTSRTASSKTRRRCRSRLPRRRFQRLDDTNDLYKTHLGVDLEALAGSDNWTALHRAAAIRHVLTHSAGEIDAKFLQRLPQWHQAEGQRLSIGRAETLAFLDALTRFADAVVS
jgi:hypothetical protein